MIVLGAAVKRSTHIAARTGSPLHYATQIHHTHGVAKTSEAVGERISLAFRVKPDQPPPKASGDSGFYR
jgi:hypothetical protein